MIKHSQSELQKIAGRVRAEVIKMIYQAGSGHPGGSLSATDILTALYFGGMEEDDRFFLSNGHVCPALYAVMAEKGLIDKNLLSGYADLDSPLEGHPERTKLRGIENTSGPLGLGLAQAAGFAAVLKLDSKPGSVFCMTSDAEHNEGNHWEAVMFAAKYKLGNLIQIVDRNRIQIEGATEEIMPIGGLAEKYKQFEWDVAEISGHSFDEIFLSIEAFKKSTDKPNVIIANTTFGKGVSYMENSPDWHAKAPNKDEYTKAMEELAK